jgi:sigma-B regulation protein RsbU (phosphoserine phosphatase)
LLEDRQSLGTLERLRKGEGPEIVEHDPVSPFDLVFAESLSFEGSPLGVVWVRYSLERFEREFRAETLAVQERAQRTIVASIGLGLAVVLIGVVVVVLQTYRITRPLQLVSQAASRIASGEFDERVPVRGHDEVAQLGTSFNEMAARLEQYLHQVTAKAALDRELEVARSIQQSLLPSGEETTEGGLSLAGVLQTADSCGGDWWLRHNLDDHRTLVVIADVTGHGLAAAMVVAAAMGAMRAVVSFGQGVSEPAYLLRALNQAVLQGSGGQKGMTCFVSVVDTARGTIRYANAGHNFPLIWRGTAGGAAKLIPLVVVGPSLGTEPDPQYREREMALAAEDVIVWFTDGLVECEGPNGDQFGNRRLQKVLTESAAAANGPAFVRDRILECVLDFARPRALDDDLTLVVGHLTDLTTRVSGQHVADEVTAVLRSPGVA